MSSLRKYDSEVHNPDEFISNLVNLDGKKCPKALENQVKSLKNPPETREEILEALPKWGLVDRSDLLKNI